MELIQAIVLGIVQGLTEWLPISSTAHLRVVPALLGWEDPGAAFTAVIQIGTLFAAIIYFRRDLWSALSAWVRSFKTKESSPEARMGWAIFYGTIPIVIFGFLFKDQIKGAGFRSIQTMAIMLIVMGVLLLVAEKVGKRGRPLVSVQPKDGWLVGLWQAIALIPGASRSGSTITGSLLLGFDRTTAARFSFLLSTPSIAAAGIFELIEERKAILNDNLMPTIVATLVSFVVGYASIAFLMKFLQTKSTMVFIVYRVALGVLLLVLLSRGVVS
ncbi:MAG TPA: undecaprenyl-diphosphate phosphatase [Fimbriimonadaceae bacterium]|nr:undecaprenyl-diphosphate phosphatase [Fimbriimonadaceae bacterium]